jgi:hypothetical protein
LALVLVSGLTAASSKASTSSGAVGVFRLEQAVVLGVIDVQVAEFGEGVVL